MTELLKQKQCRPMSMAHEVIQIYCGVVGYLDDIKLSQVTQFVEGFVRYMEERDPELVQKIESSGDLDVMSSQKLDKEIAEFAKQFVPGTTRLGREAAGSGEVSGDVVAKGDKA